MSEVLVGKALKDGYRDKVNLATKLPPWFVNNKEDMDKILNEQLTRLQTDHIDFYLLHALNRNSWPKLKELGVIPWINEMKAQGKIRNLGFSFHDDTETFKKIVDDYEEWVFCQVQNNFMDIHEQAGTRRCPICRFQRFRNHYYGTTPRWPIN